MISLPKEFTATKLPGYFWNTQTKRLYSIKVTGELRELKRQKPNRWNNYTAGYQVSYKGNRRWLREDYLGSLKSVDKEIKAYSRKEMKRQ